MLLNIPLTFCSLRNFDLLLLHTKHFEKSFVLLIFVFETPTFLLFVFFFYTSNNKITLFFIESEFLFVAGIFDFFFHQNTLH